MNNIEDESDIKMIIFFYRWKMNENLKLDLCLKFIFKELIDKFLFCFFGFVEVFGNVESLVS